MRHVTESVYQRPSAVVEPCVATIDMTSVPLFTESGATNPSEVNARASFITGTSTGRVLVDGVVVGFADAGGVAGFDTGGVGTTGRETGGVADGLADPGAVVVGVVVGHGANSHEGATRPT